MNFKDEVCMAACIGLRGEWAECTGIWQLATLQSKEKQQMYFLNTK